jgi:phage gpG-like protein
VGLKGLRGITKVREAVLKLPRFMSRASTDAADLLEDSIEHQFDTGTDPFGGPWAPLAASTMRRGRTPPPLTDEGLLRAVHVVPLQSAGVLVEFDEEYASFHQTGTSKMPKRQLAPEPEQFTSSSWYGAVVYAYANAFDGQGGWRVYGDMTASGYQKNPKDARVTLVFDAAAEE